MLYIILYKYIYIYILYIYIYICLYVCGGGWMAIVMCFILVCTCSFMPMSSAAS